MIDPSLQVSVLLIVPAILGWIVFVIGFAQFNKESELWVLVYQEPYEPVSNAVPIYLLKLVVSSKMLIINLEGT